MAEYFNIISRTSAKPYIPHYWLVRPTPGVQLWYPSVAMMQELRQEVVPEFMRAAQVNPDKNGFRMVVDLERGSNSVLIHLFAGENVPATNPQDWRTPFFRGWKRTQPSDPPNFFSLCAEAAAIREPTMKFGNQIFYPEVHEGAFVVADADPKSEIHRLVLARDTFGTMVDDGFSEELWFGFFGSASSVLLDMPDSIRYARYIANFGLGYQVGPRVHMHVLAASTELPLQFPGDYGFRVKEDATIEAPAGSSGHEEVVRLIDKRLTLKGFSPEVAAERIDLDKKIMAELCNLRKNAFELLE